VRPTYIAHASSWEEADERFVQYVADMPLRREQLAGRVSETGGPPLDRGIDGLDDLNEWYIDTALRDLDDGMDRMPHHSRTAEPHPDWTPNDYIPRWVSPQVSRLWAMLAVHVGDVMLGELAESRWVVWRSKHQNEAHNGLYSIDIGDPARPSAVVASSNAGIVRAYEHYGMRAYERPDMHRLRENVERDLERARAVREAGTQRWQKAPTGPDARRKVRPFPGRHVS
jgi:hypothetical protein